MIWIIVGAAVVALGVVVLLIARHRSGDGVSSFQRQIDALSPAARRGVVDRVRSIDDSDRPVHSSNSAAVSGEPLINDPFDDSVDDSPDDSSDEPGGARGA